MNKISNVVKSRRCPNCAGAEVYRSPRRGFFELVLLSSIGVRPFRCQGCSNRFYGFRLRRRVWSPRERDLQLGSEAVLSVLVYGNGIDKEPFQEATDVRLVSMHSAELSLIAKVEPGQKLVLMDPVSDEEQRCRVVSVTEQAGGQSIVGVGFKQSVWEFWSVATASSRK
jgi:hypothetical protein